MSVDKFRREPGNPAHPEQPEGRRRLEPAVAGRRPQLPDKRSIQGVPVQWSPAVDEDVIWGIPQAKVFVVLRLPASTVTDRSAYFSSDGVGIRAVLRVGFAFPHEQAVIKISVGASKHRMCDQHASSVAVTPGAMPPVPPVDANRVRSRSHARQV